MRTHGSNIESRSWRGRTALLLGGLVAASCAIAIGVMPAPAQQSLEEQRSALSSDLNTLNRQIDVLLGEEARVRARESAAQAELSAKQAELDRATAALAAERARLADVRERLERAIRVLEGRLVDIYKTGEPDVVSIVLDSASFDDVVSQSEYLSRLQQSDNVVVARVRALQDQVEDAIAKIAAARKQIEGARDELTAKRDELASARAAVEARHAKLAAARALRKRQLNRLNLEFLSGGQAPVGPAGQAKLVNGMAIAPRNAPAAVKGVIAAANRIRTKPYMWGGGHGSFESSGYDCSGAVSYALHGGGLLSSPMDSGGFMTYGAPGFGRWITTYAHSGHMYAVIAGLRWDTSGTGGSGPRWSSVMRSSAGFVARHPGGY